VSTGGLREQWNGDGRNRPNRGGQLAGDGNGHHIGRLAGAVDAGSVRTAGPASSSDGSDRFRESRAKSRVVLSLRSGGLTLGTRPRCLAWVSVKRAASQRRCRCTSPKKTNSSARTRRPRSNPRLRKLQADRLQLSELPSRLLAITTRRRLPWLKSEPTRFSG